MDSKREPKLKVPFISFFKVDLQLWNVVKDKNLLLEKPRIELILGPIDFTVEGHFDDL